MSTRRPNRKRWHALRKKCRAKLMRKLVKMKFVGKGFDSAKRSFRNCLRSGARKAGFI